MAHVGGVPHPPGYPLYTMIVHGFTTVVPFGSPAFRANLFSAICASGTSAPCCTASSSATSPIRVPRVNRVRVS